MKSSISIQVLLLFLVCHAKAQSLSSTKWLLTSVFSETEQNVLNDTTIKTILFFKTDSIYSGELCNGYFGKYRSDPNGNFTMKRPMATKKYCLGGYSELEMKLFSWFENVVYYSLSDQVMILSTRENYKLVFKKLVYE